MTSILGTLSALITPEMVSNLGKQVGLSDELTRQGLVISNAVLAGGIARAASTPEGAASVAQMVEKADSSVLSNLVGLASSALGSGNSAASEIFGPNFDLVTSGVKKATGIDIVPLLSLCTPVVLGVIKNMAAQQQLDADGLASLLQSEVKGLARRDGNTAKVIKEVFKPLEAQDKLRATFSAEEWAALQQAPIHAAALIILADRSGSSGRGKEIAALRDTLAEAVASAGPAELNALLFRDAGTTDTVEGLIKDFRKTDEAEREKALIEPITQALSLAKSKAPRGDATAYQGLLISVAQQVAGAAKEGGFLGMGGTNVSADEKAALDALVAAVSAS